MFNSKVGKCPYDLFVLLLFVATYLYFSQSTDTHFHMAILPTENK